MNELLGKLRAIVGDDGALDDPHDLATYERGWRYGAGRARLAVRPRTTDEVSRVLAACHVVEARVQPMGANTGLVGASNPDATGAMVVLSLERLARTIEVDAVDGVALVDAGVTLSALNEALAPHGLMYPIDLGADPQLGGMIATNTGGTRLVRYGDVRANLLGLEVVLADGTVVSRLTRLRKDNTGLDLKQLFVGTSGLFGVVTRAVVRVVPKPRQRVATLACAASGEAVLQLLATLQASVGELLSAYEAVSREALAAVLRHGSYERNPFQGAPPAYAVLIELSSALAPEVLDLEGALEAALGAHLEGPHADGIEDVLVGRADDVWHLRHQVSESLREEGAVIGLDLSVPRSRMAEFTEVVRARLAARFPGVRVADFGHWGDGGTHLNLVHDPALTAADAGATWKRGVQDFVYSICVDEFDGSFSAEHGVGPHNLAAYERFTHATARDVCAALRAQLDPHRSLGTFDL
ncbi:MAG: FAD-binding oxidoreductase [Planctomycetota bacterium]